MYSSLHEKREQPGTAKVVFREVITFIRIFVFFGLLFLFTQACAQTQTATRYPESHVMISPESHGATLQRKAVPYPYVREADVMWAKRIWRTIDLREKMNHPYYYPETPHNGLMSLFDIVKEAVLTGQATAFDNPAMDDEFKVKMNAEAVAALLQSKELVEVEDPYNPGTYILDTVVNEVMSSDVMAWWVKEDWFFDKQRSVMDVRIVGICPLMQKKDPNSGDPLGMKPLFWCYFPQLRPILVKHEIYLGQNNGQRLTYDDIFQKRFFGSYIHKESNVYDRPIPEYLKGLDALLESESVKEGIMNFESDLWHY